MLLKRKFRITIMAAAALAITALCPDPTRAAATLTTLAVFNAADGALPRAGLLADAAGNLFGTTATGGATNQGTVFEIAKTASGYANTPTVLYNFCAQPNCADGAVPNGLIADAAGNLFGTTAFGGATNQGTAFEIAKTANGYASTPTVLVSFGGTGDTGPIAGLLADAAGNLFGTTFLAGANPGFLDEGAGTVFEIAKTASGYANTPTVLYNFCAQTNCTDGAEPNGLIADAAGNLLGTTQSFGANGGIGGVGAGTVFEIAKTASGYASTPTVLYSFCGQTNCTDGAVPNGLIADSAGNLFGTTALGGA
jgi:uncharacterized repeat protein (TIGR03803 family)